MKQKTFFSHTAESMSSSVWGTGLQFTWCFKVQFNVLFQSAIARPSPPTHPQSSCLGLFKDLKQGHSSGFYCIQSQFLASGSFSALLCHTRASGAPHLRKFWLSVHPRNFSNHLTVRLSSRPSAPQGNQCNMSSFLASIGGL